MRDRLIKVIGNKPFTSEYENYNSVEWAEHFADHLLANGVVIIDPQKYPPVNNQRIIKTVLGVSLDEMAELIDAKQEGRIIVPPCKVGDTVYISENPYTFLPLKKAVEGEVVSIHLHEYGLFIRVLFDTKKINGCVDYNLDWKLGKTVFLTREEAERALKGADDDKQ